MTSYDYDRVYGETLRGEYPWTQAFYMLCGGMGIAGESAMGATFTTPAPTPAPAAHTAHTAGGSSRAQAMVEQRIKSLASDLAEARGVEAEKEGAVKRTRRSVRTMRRRLEVISSPQLLVAQARALNMLVPVHAADVARLYCSDECLPPEEPPSTPRGVV